MRVIKFRAWDGEEMIDDAMGIEEMDTGPHPHMKNIVPVAFMQFTGLLDKAGKEIYEGDIIISTIGNEVIEYDEKTVSFKAFTKGRFKSAFNNTREKKDLEIIGNIHENPDLLND